MFDWFTRRRRIKGGLYFGSPGWNPDKIELAGDESPVTLHPPTDITPRETPTDRAGFTALIEHIALTRTSSITPGLLEQLHDLGDRHIRALVLNLLPTQPEFALATGLSRTVLEEMTTGLVAIQKVVRAKKVIIAIDRHEYRTRRLWQRAMKGHRSTRYTFAKLLNRYPQAHPTILLRSLFGKRTAVGKLPTRANRIILDPVACWGVGRYILTGRSFTHRPVQLFAAYSKSRPASARLAMGVIGETVAAFCARFNIATENMQVIANGMMAGEEMDPAIACIQSDTESISIRERPALELPTPCFSCGWCLDVCPTGLNPVNLLDLAERAQGGIETAARSADLRSWDARESLHCIGCGLCSYVCPTRLPLTQQALRLRSWVAASATNDTLGTSNSTPPENAT